jgi:uncharacterized protein YpmB
VLTAPFIIIIFIINKTLGKRPAKNVAIGLGLVLAVLVLGALIVNLQSKPKETSVTLAGEKVSAEVVRKHYPASRYSVKGSVIELAGKNLNNYSINIAVTFDENEFNKINTEVCTKLSDKKARVKTAALTNDVYKNRGVGGNCTSILSMNR